MSPNDKVGDIWVIDPIRKNSERIKSILDPATQVLVRTERGANVRITIQELGVRVEFEGTDPIRDPMVQLRNSGNIFTLTTERQQARLEARQQEEVSHVDVGPDNT